MQESGGIPTTKAGFTQKILDMAIAQGEKLIVGTPEEQTRALLQDLSKKASTASTPKASTMTKPTGGQSTQSIKSSNPSDIPTQSTPTTPKSKGIRGFVSGGLTSNTEAKQFTRIEDILKTNKTTLEKSVLLEDFAPLLKRYGYTGLMNKASIPRIEDFMKGLRKENAVERSQKAIKANTPTDKMKPFLGPKKKVVSSLEQEAKKYKTPEDYMSNTAKYIHETNAPDIKEFDMSKIGSGQGEAWLGQGVYLSEKGSFKFENYGKNKIETALSPEAKIFKIKETPDGKWRDNLVEWYNNNHPEYAKSMESWENPKNILPRDLLKNRGEYDFGTPTIIKELRDAGYDGLLQDGELVIYNPKVLKTKSQLTEIWNKANKK